MVIPHLLWLWETNKQTDLHALNNFSSSIEMVSLKKKKNHVSGPCSFGGKVVHVDVHTQSDAIMSADIMNTRNYKVMK